MSLRAYGRHRQALGLPGGNAVAVSRAIATQRLVESVVAVDGVAQIADVALADAEWARNTDLSKAPSAVKAQAAQAVTLPVTATVTAPPSVTPSPPRRGKPTNSLAEASTREKNARADLAELEYQEKVGQLVSAKAVESAWSDMTAQMRTAVLSVPSKAKSVLPHLTHTDLAQLNELLCQALDGLADKASGDAAGAAA